MDSDKPQDTEPLSKHRERYYLKTWSLVCKSGRLIINILASCLVLCPRSMRPATTKKPHELHPTAYLDALRGYAAWIVYNYHVIPGKWTRHSMLAARPFSILFKGSAMVDIFFVISGFALSYSVLGYMHSNQHLRVLDSLASSVFRRHLRLYLPVTCVSFVSMLAISTGVAVKKDVLQPTFAGNVWYWIKDTVRSCNPFSHVVSWWFKGVGPTHTDYIPQAWTIPVELRGSLILFLFCVAVCRMTTRARMWTTLASTFACFWWITPYAGLFLFGMWLADRRHLRMRSQQGAVDCLPSARSPDEDTVQEVEHPAATVGPIEAINNTGSWANFWRLNKINATWRSHESPISCEQIPFLVLASLSIWPLTAPNTIEPTSTFPYNIMAMTLPPNWRGNRGESHWPYSVGAMMLCYALDRSPLLQRPFNLPLSQFIGELSFGIYVTHNLVRWIFWDRYLLVWARTYLGDSPRYQLPGYIVMTILVFWAAEIFRRVDVRCVQLTKRLQDLFFER